MDNNKKTEWYLFSGLLFMIPLCIYELWDYFWILFCIAIIGLYMMFYGISRCEY